MLKMGGMQGLMGMMPGMGKHAGQADNAGINDKMLHHQIALINSMTKKERANPDLLAASRKKRIAAGAGLDVADLNRLLKQHKQMADMMKKMGKGGMMKNMIKQFLGKGGMPDPSKMSPEQLAEAAKGMQQGMGGIRRRRPSPRPRRPSPRHHFACRSFGADEEEMMQEPRPQLTGLPVLETERLVLRAPQASDWPTFRAFRASPRTAYSGGTKSAHEAAQQFSAFFGHWVLRGFGRLIAEDRKSGQPLGHFGPTQWEDETEVELTWSLWTAEAEGKGLATEAAIAMHSWAFGPLGLATARTEVHRDNAASHAIARRLGGHVVHGERPDWMPEGTVYRFAKRAEQAPLSRGRSQ